MHSCKGKCNAEHTGDCQRGQLSESWVCCATTKARLSGRKVSFAEFKTVEVETHGKGLPYTRVEKVLTEVSWKDFLEQFRYNYFMWKYIRVNYLNYRELCLSYSQHIIVAWFLRSTKLQLLDMSASARPNTAILISDFAENVLVVRWIKIKKGKYKLIWFNINLENMRQLTSFSTDQKF